MKDYRIVTADSLVNLYLKVKDKISQDYIPISGITIDNSSKSFKFIQVVYKGDE